MSVALFDLTGKVAVVTGSTRGLGLAIARGLAKAGATVIVNGRHPETVADTSTALRSEGLDSRPAAFDVTDPAAVEQNIKAIGAIDILVNNAGIQKRKPVLEFVPAEWTKVIETNLTAPFLVARAVIPGMIERGGGKIINICSLTSELGRPTVVPYTAAKGGLKMLTRGLAAELGGFNIQVNAIGPGYFRTELNAELLADRAFEAWVRSRTPAGRWGEPEELVGTAVFLASQASDYVNGQLIFVDGGVTAVV